MGAEKMKLLIKQRVFSWTDTYDVYNEYGEVKYFVKSEFFSLGHKIHIYDSQQREVGMIQEKVLAFLPRFEVLVEGRVVGQIEKKFSFMKPKYEIDYKNWQVEGDFWGWNYCVIGREGSIVSITKELLHWGDTYVLDIQNLEDEISALLLVIAIDAANCSHN
ncbi:MAG: LURP-one-related family protein [Lachnospiraceae bacterium]|nr:LURP-one-related family protein [Lachnospiraceae bacterium]